jgi:hypothetical protein
MEPERYKLAVNLFTCLLSRLIPPTLPDNLITKTTYKLYAGFKAVDRDGNRLTLYPFGPDLRWLIEAITWVTRDENFFLGDTTPIEKIEYTGESASLLIEAALQDPLALEATKELVETLIEQGKDLPTDLQNFVNDLFLGKVKPKNRGNNRMPNFHRNICIILCISALEKKNFTPISKSSPYYPQLTLCDAIQKALRTIGIDLCYETIRTAWKNRKFSQEFTKRFYINISDENTIEIGYNEPSFPLKSSCSK